MLLSWRDMDRMSMSLIERVMGNFLITSSA